MKNVSIKTTVTLQEKKSGKKEKVKMILDPKEDILWCMQKDMFMVDAIDAEFKNDGPSKGKPGMVSVWISLLGGATWVAPGISLKKNSPPNSTIECIEHHTEKDETIMVLTFLDPQKKNEYYYPNIYFHTSEGVVDPSISITRPS